MVLANGDSDLKFRDGSGLVVVIQESLHKAVGYVSFSQPNYSEDLETQNILNHGVAFYNF